MIERARLAERFEAIPQHVALVMEGTDSWAHEHGRSEGDAAAASAAALRETVRTAGRYGIEILTVHARCERMTSIFATAECEALQRANVRLRVLGPLATASQATRRSLAGAVRATAGCDGTLLNLAVDYGARIELCEAIRAIARDVRSGRLSVAGIDDELLSKYLYTHGLPDPDLMIRTGGELRLSNFLLYQIAYSELWSTTTLWPDFDRSDFEAALAAFANRQRRFGS